MTDFFKFMLKYQVINLQRKWNKQHNVVENIELQKCINTSNINEFWTNVNLK